MWWEQRARGKSNLYGFLTISVPLLALSPWKETLFLSHRWVSNEISPTPPRPLRICQLGFESPHVQAVCSCNPPFLPTGGSAALSMWRRGGWARIFFLHRPSPPLPSHLPASQAVRLQLWSWFCWLLRSLLQGWDAPGIGNLPARSVLRWEAGRQWPQTQRTRAKYLLAVLGSSGALPQTLSDVLSFHPLVWKRRLELREASALEPGSLCCRAVHRTLSSHLYNPVTTSPSFMCVGRLRPGREGFSLGNRWQGWGEDPVLLTVWGLP